MGTCNTFCYILDYTIYDKIYNTVYIKNNMYIKPKTKLGKWSAGLNILFLIIISVSVISVLVLKILNFDGHWWDVTVPVSFLIEMTAFVTGIISVTKNKERSVLVYFSIFVGILTILFVLLHSLFIND